MIFADLSSNFQTFESNNNVFARTAFGIDVSQKYLQWHETLFDLESDLTIF